jgi:hypothetical protein
LIQLYRWFPSILKAVMIIRPETVVRWHRAGFRRYWRWKSRNPGGRPRIDAGLRALIRQMSIENWLWGAPRVTCCGCHHDQRIFHRRACGCGRSPFAMVQPLFS